MKKNIAIFTFVQYSENSMVASLRIAKFLSAFLWCPVTDHKTIDDVKDRLDVLYIVNGAFAFCKCLEQLAQLIKTARRVVWVQNDYTIIPPKYDSEADSPFRAAFREREEQGMPRTDYWTTCEDWASLTPESRYVNWNALTFDPAYDPKAVAKRRGRAPDDLLYYGSYRNGSGKSSRQRYFDRYFASPTVRTVISSPSPKFRDRYKNQQIDCVGPIQDGFFETLGLHGMGLYLEDRLSHERFHSPANRFYEMLSAGLPMVFQPECGSMMRRAGYDPTPFQAGNVREIERMMKRREEIGEQQRELWIGKDPGKFRRVLEDQVMQSHQVMEDALS